ncbi:hypothetical protein K8R62_01700 [bacterium]|nr:hypothetical protein [bacterium]
MGNLDGKFSPDNFLSEEGAENANARLEIEKEEKGRERDQFLKDFELDDLLSEYSQNIPGFEKIRDEIIDELMSFIDTKTGVDFDNPKEKQILSDTLKNKFAKKIEDLRKAS